LKMWLKCPMITGKKNQTDPLPKFLETSGESVLSSVLNSLT
jgi:hypothetical protein